jgi:phosphate-selective porin OprO/OprP
MRRLCLILLLTVLLGAGSVQAQADGAESVLIRDVRLIDREGEAEDVMANILIKKGRLDLVTKDRIPSSEADLALDAKEGILLGKLELGEPASFVILDEDPRENVEILLDTATHIRFAIVKGEILRNNLSPVTAAEEEVEKRGWLAYTPPPIALPLSYQDKKRWNHFETKPVSGLFIAAVVLDRQRWLSQDAESEEQVGDLDEFNRGEIRGFRFGLVGTFNFKRPWVYTLAGATNAFDKGFETEKNDDITLFDYRLDIPLFQQTAVSIGKQKEPISMERLIGGLYLPIFERSSVSDALMPARNVGIVFNGVAPNRRFTWAVGGFNDWIDASQSFDESAKQVVGRITGLPLVSADESNVFHLGLGVRYTDANEGLRYRTDPEFNLSPDFVDTDFMEADRSTTYDLEASWRRGPFWLHGEYLRNEVAAPDLGDPVFSGHHFTASWIISGEMRAYNRRSGVFGPVPVARSVYRGGWGAWEVALRWTDLDLTDGAIEGGEMQVLSAAVNWWLTSYFSFNIYYRNIQLDRFGLQGTSDGMLARVVLMLE